MSAASVAVRGFGFRPGGRSSWALRDINLDVAPGEHVLLLGASGSGKSTLLRALAGLLPRSGEAVGDVLIDDLPALAARDKVGLLLQDPDAFLVLSRAGEDVAFGPQNRGLPPAEVQRRVSTALAGVGFPYPADRSVSALSGGERQRLALAGVLALAPGLLLLDEPTSMLDPAGAALVRQAVSSVARATGATLIVVEHRVAEWLPLVDRVMVLTPGGIAADGTAEQVSRQPAAEGTWLVHRQLAPPAPAVPRELLLHTEDLGFRYPHADTAALAGIGADVLGGSVLAVTGPNGSGKSTLARMIGGLAKPTTGSVTATGTLTGSDVGDKAPRQWRARDLAGRIGSVFQNPEHSFLTNSVREELAIGPRALGWSPRVVDRTVDRLLDRMRLTPLASVNPFTLSGGEQRRLSVAAALAAEPRTLVLDEPTFGQDPTAWRQLAELVLHLRDEGAGIVVITHDLEFAETVADRALHLTQGRELHDR
ncbi:MAG TPA: ATP-binding cassette domain-containing protein [Actinomycetes bacterium]|nr:ATP-binding cassette domain-containing protein [Actinomycetes bacterium]